MTTNDKNHTPTHVGVSEMNGPVIGITVFKKKGFKLLGVDRFVRETLAKIKKNDNEHNLVIVECLASARTALAKGKQVLLVCAVIRDKKLPGDMERKRNFMVYPQNGCIKHLSACEFSLENKFSMNVSVPHGTFYMERLSRMLPSCEISFHMEEFDNWVCILCVPN